VQVIRIAYPFVTMPVGGAEDLILSIVRRLPPDISPRLVCLRSLGMLGEEAKAEGLPVELVPVFPTKRINPFGIWKFSRWLREQGVRLVHAQTYHDQLFAVPAAKLAGIPSVVHLHKTMADLGGRKGFLMKRIFRMADHVVTLSEETRREVISSYGIDTAKVTALPNAVDPSVFFPGDFVAGKAALGLGSGFLIGSVAQLHHTKNHEATIAAMGMIGEETPCTCRIFGEGQERGALEGLISSGNLRERVILEGRKRPIAPWFRALDLFVLPSRWEGQPMAILQALACGIPILASRIEGNVAILGEGHPGLFPPEDHRAYAGLITKAIREPSFRRELLAYQSTLTPPSLDELTKTLASFYRRLV
jgi:glycosyltransferase involved in cell wall biosynthesis